MLFGMSQPHEVEGTDQSQRWRLTDAFLVEERGDGGIRLWGRWDRQFGCWDGDGRPVTPRGKVLGRLGTWFEPAGERDDGWYASRSAITAYWSIIPTPVRLIVSQQDISQWAALLAEWRRRPAANTQLFRLGHI
jgi:hypothetical protein